MKQNLQFQALNDQNRKIKENNDPRGLSAEVPRWKVNGVKDSNWGELSRF